MYSSAQLEHLFDESDVESEHPKIDRLDVEWLKKELEYGKGHYVRWGRMVIEALDLDDGLSLFEVFDHQQYWFQSNINVQTTILGYSDHIWTAWMHSHIGDTALHMAIKQKKMLCVYALLLLHAEFNIPNELGDTAADLCQIILNVSVRELQIEALRCLTPFIDPRFFHKIPDVGNFFHRNIEQESWSMMMDGRGAYTEQHITPMTKYVPCGTKNTLQDIIDLVDSQSKRRVKIDLNDQFRRSGLALLSNIKAGDGAAGTEEAIASTTLTVATTDNNKVLYENLPDQVKDILPSLAGVQKLKFLKNLKNTFAAESEGRDQKTANPTAKSAEEGQLAEFVEKLTSDNQEVAVTSIADANTDDAAAPVKSFKRNEDEYLERVSVRDITILSTTTNMKYLKIGNEGLIALTDILVDNYVITRINLSHARISVLDHFCHHLPSFRSLCYLDMSYNGIDDAGALLLVTGLYQTSVMMPITDHVEDCFLDGSYINEGFANSERNKYSNFVADEEENTGEIKIDKIKSYRKPYVAPVVMSPFEVLMKSVPKTLRYGLAGGEHTSAASHDSEDSAIYHGSQSHLSYSQSTKVHLHSSHSSHMHSDNGFLTAPHITPPSSPVHRKNAIKPSAACRPAYSKARRCPLNTLILTNNRLSTKGIEALLAVFVDIVRSTVYEKHDLLPKPELNEHDLLIKKNEEDVVVAVKPDRFFTLNLRNNNHMNLKVWMKKPDNLNDKLRWKKSTIISTTLKPDCDRRVTSATPAGVPNILVTVATPAGVLKEPWENADSPPAAIDCSNPQTHHWLVL